MPEIIEDTDGKIRDLPISDRLRDILEKAAEASGVDVVRVVSGGQCAKGTCSKRTGSTRHDLGNAADLELEIGGVAQDFTTTGGRQVFSAFATNSAARGATGIGAGPGYMGPRRMHVGFGKKAVWGKDGQLANAPVWLVEAVNGGWENPMDLRADSDGATPDGGEEGEAQADLHQVIARSGLNLRGGPGTEFPARSLLGLGTEVNVLNVVDSWAQVDLEMDGHADGFVHSAFIRPV